MQWQMGLTQMHDECKIIATLKFHRWITLAETASHPIPFGPYIVRVVSGEFMSLTAFHTAEDTLAHHTLNLHQAKETRDFFIATKLDSFVPNYNEVFQCQRMKNFG